VGEIPFRFSRFISTVIHEVVLSPITYVAACPRKLSLDRPTYECRQRVASRQSICLKLPLDTKMLIFGTESIE
jgi:hypothetical protein